MTTATTFVVRGSVQRSLRTTATTGSTGSWKPTATTGASRSTPTAARCVTSRGPVSLPTNGADSAPGAIEIWHSQTGKCADVEGPSTAAGAPIQQWSCVNVPQQEWKVHPSTGFPGWFNVVSEHSGLSMAGSGSASTVRQQPCDNTSRVRWTITGVDYLDKQVFSFRDASAGLANCVEVPVDVHTDGQNLTYPACPGPNTVTLWMVWRMSDATP